MPEKEDMSGKELVPLSGRPIEGGMTKEENEASRRKLFGGEESEAGQPESEKVIEGEFRDVPERRYYPQVRLDLETARRGYRGLAPEGREAVNSRLREAGFEFDSDGRPVDPDNIETMTDGQVRDMIEKQGGNEEKREEQTYQRSEGEKVVGDRSNWENRLWVARQLDDPEAYKLAIEAAEGALRLAMDEGQIDEYRRVKRALDAMSAKLSASAPDDLSVGAQPVAEVTKRVEIPAEARELKLFLRERIKEVIRLIADDEALMLVNVRDKVVSGLGFDPKTFTPVDLYGRLPADQRDDVREEVEGEIMARCVLRAAEIKEVSYKAMGDKGAAVNRYMNDMKGSESGGATAAIIDRDTFLWLKDLKDEGDGLSRRSIDRAFAIFVTLGEREPDFSASWMQQFEKFRPKKRKADGTETWGTNYYDPSYDHALKVRALEQIERSFGKDATNLAWQMFQAFKEEGNYNWQHYLARDFTFANTRNSLATMLTPPVYIGSRRIYETKKGKYTDELQAVAVSALRLKAKVGEDPDPSVEDPTRTKDRMEKDVFLKRSKRGAFLADTPFGDQNMVKEGRMPQQLSYNTVKDGEKFRSAIVAIGDLGKEADKTSKIGTAIGALVDLRSFGQSLVEAGVMTLEELNKQIEIEARNVLWELSVENPNNVQDLAVQAKGKQNFLSPSGLNTLFQAMGGRTREGYPLIGTDEAYTNLGTIFEEVREKSWDVFEGLDGEDEALIEKEKHAKQFIQLPRQRGNPLVDNIGKVNRFMTEAVAKPASKIISPLADILFPEILFGKRKRG